MSDVNDLASSLFGTSRAEVASGGTSTLYGTAATDSSGGSVSVRMGADTLRADGQAGTSVLVPTTTDVRAGETVIVTVVDGHPVVTGVVGSGDRTRADVEAAQGTADAATESAKSALDAVAEVRADADAHGEQIDAVKQDIAAYKASAQATYATKTEVDDKTGALTKTIEADYLKADDASTTYATKTELTESADGVEQRVSETYATKKSLTDYEGTVSKTYATQTALDQTNESIDAKASETLSSAKSYADGKVEAEVVDRDAAIKVATDNVTLQASQTYATIETTDGLRSEMRATYATNANLQVLRDSIVSAVSGEVTYTAPDGSTKTNELATKVEQTDTSLTTTISRTDALETMVHEYSGGVLVSKIKNGATVNGALVNADGSFDVVNVTWNSGTPTVGKKLMRLAKNSIEFNNPDTSYNICNITANGTLTNINVPNGSLAIDETPAWCQALGDSGYDSFIAGKMLQLGAGNRTTYSEILIEPDGTTIDGYKFALGTNDTTDTWVPVMGGGKNAGHLFHRVINLKWGPNAYAVYGAYNPNAKDHYYTTNVNEYNNLVKNGWTGNGVYFYAAL